MPFGRWLRDEPRQPTSAFPEVFGRQGYGSADPPQSVTPGPFFIFQKYTPPGTEALARRGLRCDPEPGERGHQRDFDEMCVIKPRLPAARIVLAVSFFFVRDSTSNERF